MLIHTGNPDASASIDISTNDNSTNLETILNELTTLRNKVVMTPLAGESTLLDQNSMDISIQQDEKLTNFFRGI